MAARAGARWGRGRACSLRVHRAQRRGDDGDSDGNDVVGETESDFLKKHKEELEDQRKADAATNMRKFLTYVNAIRVLAFSVNRRSSRRRPFLVIHTSRFLQFSRKGV